MARRKLTVSQNSNFSPSIKSDRDIFYDLSFDDFFDLFDKFMELKALEGLAPRSLEDYKNHMNYFKKFLSSDQRTELIRCVNIDVFRAYLHYMIYEKEYKPCTVNIRLRTLKAYLKWLFRENYLDSDISNKLRLVKEPIDTIHPLADSDVKKMLKIPNRSTYAGYRNFTLMILMLDTGIRVNEAINLKFDDIDLNTGLINVGATSAKTRISRQLPISRKTCKLLKELISVARETDLDFVFQSAYCKKLTTDQVIHNFITYGKKAKINKRCTPHVFRHTFATNFVKNNGDIFSLQRILGHSTLAMCRKYIQLNSSDLIKKHKQVCLLDKYVK